jgi:hypothetical protein
VYRRSPRAIGVETDLERSAISSGWVGSKGSTKKSERAAGNSVVLSTFDEEGLMWFQQLR